MVDEPGIGMLATAAGISGVIFVIMQLVRGVMTEALYDRWAPLIAVGIGIVLALAYDVVTDGVTGESLLSAVLVGLFAGGFSQNVNTIVRRAITTGG